MFILGVCACHITLVEVRVTCKKISSLIMWGLRVELRLSGSPASTSAC